MKLVSSLYLGALALLFVRLVCSSRLSVDAVAYKKD